MTGSSPVGADLVLVLRTEFGKKERDLGSSTLPTCTPVKPQSIFSATWFNLTNFFKEISS